MTLLNKMEMDINPTTTIINALIIQLHLSIQFQFQNLPVTNLTPSMRINLQLVLLLRLDLLMNQIELTTLIWMFSLSLKLLMSIKDSIWTLIWLKVVWVCQWGCSNFKPPHSKISFDLYLQSLSINLPSSPHPLSFLFGLFFSACRSLSLITFMLLYLIEYPPASYSRVFRVFAFSFLSVLQLQNHLFKKSRQI